MLKLFAHIPTSYRNDDETAVKAKLVEQFGLVTNKPFGVSVTYHDNPDVWLDIAGDKKGIGPSTEKKLRLAQRWALADIRLARSTP